METKFTPNKIIYSFTSNILKLTILLFISTSTFGQNNSCNTSLKVDNDRNTRSTPLDGTYYLMNIINSGLLTDTYNLTSQNINNTCTNSDDSSTSNNVNLISTFFDSNLIPINNITVNSGQTASFLVHVTVPIGTQINRWCCTQIIAESSNCLNYKADSILHTRVINPNEE